MKYLVSILISIFAITSNWATDLSNLKWLAGHWKGKIEQGYMEEYFTTADGGLILGVAKTIQLKKVNFYEFMEIRAEEKKIVFIPYVNGKKQRSFQMQRMSLEEKEVVFMDSLNDFPRKIIYKLLPTKKLQIVLEGKVDNRDKVLEFVLDPQ